MGFRSEGQTAAPGLAEVNRVAGNGWGAGARKVGAQVGFAVAGSPREVWRCAWLYVGSGWPYSALSFY